VASRAGDSQVRKHHYLFCDYTGHDSAVLEGFDTDDVVEECRYTTWSDSIRVVASVAASAELAQRVASCARVSGGSASAKCDSNGDYLLTITRDDGSFSREYTLDFERDWGNFAIVGIKSGRHVYLCLHRLARRLPVRY